MLKRIFAQFLVAVLAVTGAFAQSIESVDGRQCAIPGSELFDNLAEELPGCDRYCTVDKENVPGYETFPGFVFACTDRPGLVAVNQGDDDDGLALGVLGAAAALGLLLSVAGTPSGGATNNTTTPPGRGGGR